MTTPVSKCYFGLNGRLNSRNIFHMTNTLKVIVHTTRASKQTMSCMIYLLLGLYTSLVGKNIFQNKRSFDQKEKKRTTCLFALVAKLRKHSRCRMCSTDEGLRKEALIQVEVPLSKVFKT